MTNPEVTITVKELQILFNQFQVFSDALHVSYPVIDDFDLLDAQADEDGYRIDVKTPNFSMFQQESIEIANELPAFSDFKEAFLASGCINYENAGTFESMYKKYKERNKKIFFSPDTNILYHEFLSRSFLKEERIPIAPTVLNEVIGAMNYKYNNDLLDGLEAATKSELIRALYNRRRKKSRRAAYFAKREKTRLVTIDIDPVDETPADASQNDLFIIKEVQQFVANSGSDVVILTADRPAADLCEINNMEFFMFDMPARIETQHCTARSFQELVFDLAAIFGVIKLNNTIIFGEFSNKNDLDELKVRFLSTPTHDAFMKDLRLCRRLMKLKKDLIARNMDF